MTLDGRVAAGIDAIRKRVGECEAALNALPSDCPDIDPERAAAVKALDAAREEEVAYMLQVLPYIAEYTSDAPQDSSAASAAASGSVRQGGMDSFVTVTRKSNKNNVLQRFLVEVEGNTDVPINEYAMCVSRSEEYVCHECGNLLVYENQTSSMLCTACGYTHKCADFHANNMMTYEQQTNSELIQHFAYKRLNHANEWLASVQGKESIDIPDEVLDAVRSEFKKARATTRSEITPQKTRQFLRKLKLQKYYEHTNHITNLLSGAKVAPKIPPALEDKLKHMFAEIQAPFARHCPKDRKNFLSYAYTFHKMCELLGKDEYLPYFPLLKSSEKLYQQDCIWAKICADLDWEFIKSI